MTSVNGAQNSGIVKSTAIGAGIGAAVWSGAEYFAQKKILSDPDKYVSNFKTAINSANDSGYKGLAAKLTKKLGEAEAFIKSGKINKGLIGKSALIGMAIIGGITLLVKLCSSNKTEATK